MNNRDLSLLEQNLSPDAIFDFPGTGLLHGPRKILIFLKVLFRKYPRLIFDVDDIIQDGNRIVVVWHNEGETSTRQTYQNRGVTVVHIRDDKIVLISDYFKDTSFVQSSEGEGKGRDG